MARAVTLTTPPVSNCTSYDCVGSTVDRYDSKSKDMLAWHCFRLSQLLDGVGGMTLGRLWICKLLICTSSVIWAKDRPTPACCSFKSTDQGLKRHIVRALSPNEPRFSPVLLDITAHQSSTVMRLGMAQEYSVEEIRRGSRRHCCSRSVNDQRKQNRL